ncbi:MAG: hypothetical protein M3R00_04045, partial [Pseudomonadota bacterium]|nr:hypothetical protein [Pseudomonadota bacterium]
FLLGGDLGKDLGVKFDLLTTFKEKNADINFQINLDEFKAMVTDVKAQFGVGVLLKSPAPNDHIGQGLQSLFRLCSRQNPLLGKLMLHNATGLELLQIAKDYPSSGICFAQNLETLSRPTLEAAEMVQQGLNIVAIEQVFADIVTGDNLLKRLLPKHVATLMTFGGDKVLQCIAAILKRDPDSRTKKLISLLEVSNMRLDVAARWLSLFDQAFINGFVKDIAKKIDSIQPSALVRLLHSEILPVTEAIEKQLRSSRISLYPMFIIEPCSQVVFAKLERILLEFIQSNDVRKLDEISRHMSAFLVCRKIVKSEEFISICTNNVAIFEDVFKVLLASDFSMQQREWLQDFLSKIILNMNDILMVQVNFSFVPQILQLHPKLAEVLLSRKTIVLAMDAKHQLKQAHWQEMLKIVFEGRGQNLMESPALTMELALRICRGINAKNLSEHSMQICQLLKSEQLGREIVSQSNHEQRILLFNTADDEFLQLLFELHEGDLESKLYDAMANCLDEIANQAFYNHVTKNPRWLKFIVEANSPESGHWDRVECYGVVKPAIKPAPKPKPQSLPAPHFPEEYERVEGCGDDSLATDEEGEESYEAEGPRFL